MKHALCLLMLVPASVAAQESTIVLDGVIDAYYAWDLARPADRGRAFATEPARHNEFALNLALIRAQLANARGSLALATALTSRRTTPPNPTCSRMSSRATPA